MKQLDLHGILHHQVRDEVENFILLNAKELPIPPYRKHFK